MSDHHILPLKTYFLVFGALIFGTLLTVAVTYVDLGWLNTPMALLIAGTKATIVILYFMHVKYSHKLIGLFAFTGFFFIVILLALTLQDYYSRGWQEPLPVDFLNLGQNLK
ncbi:MAG: cytochrome C oxidase subunit IV family protein [Candidatus Latescibacterota bacterium]|nr:cytochrome C oxidase subunit IV family protein [Candidatus Latescibacterota bacterium]